MNPFLKNFIKTVTLSVTFLTIESYASELYVEAEIPPITLPSDLTLTDELFRASEAIHPLEGSSTIRVIEGCVEHGQKLGRQLGFPTANISFESSNLLEGLYRAHTNVGEQSFLSFAYYSLHNFYNRPLLEIHLFDYCEDLYGQSITINLTHFIRPPVPFISNQQMSNRMKRDVELIRGIVGGF